MGSSLLSLLFLSVFKVAQGLSGMLQTHFPEKLLLLLFSFAKYELSKDLFILFEMRGCRNAETDREREFTSASLLLKAATSRVAKSREVHLGVPHECRAPSSWAIYCCLPRCIGRKLEEVEFRDSNWVLYGVLA